MTRVKSPRKIKRRSLLKITKGYKKPANNHVRVGNKN